MKKVKLKEAKAQLSELIEAAAAGEEIVITRGDGASFQIIPLGRAKPRPTFGSAKGLVEMAENFDDPLEDFEAYAP